MMSVAHLFMRERLSHKVFFSSFLLFCFRVNFIKDDLTGWCEIQFLMLFFSVVKEIILENDVSAK